LFVCLFVCNICGKRFVAIVTKL